MCSNWIIDGRFCQSGADLIEAIGAEAARRVNKMYDEVGRPGHWKMEHGRRVEIELTDVDVARSCLCWVDVASMRSVTGLTYEYSTDEDAFCPIPQPLGDSE